MTAHCFLRVHLSALLAQYGDRAVLETLAPLLGTSLPELEELLADVRKLGHARSKKPKQIPAKTHASVDQLLIEHPDKAEALRELQLRFSNRTLFPELKDVRRFLDRHGEPTSSLKKRDDAFPKVARQLVQLTLDDLLALLASPTDSSQSSLGVISDQILGRK